VAQIKITTTTLPIIKTYVNVSSSEDDVSTLVLADEPVVSADAADVVVVVGVVVGDEDRGTIGVKESRSRPSLSITAWD